MEKDSPVLVDDCFGNLGSEQDSAISRRNGCSLSLHSQLVGGKNGYVSGLQLQLLWGAFALNDGLIRMELNYLHHHY